MEENKRHILIVDDEANILNSLERLLEEDDFIVYKASSGSDGLDIIKNNNQIGVVLSDQRMPGMTGTEFLRIVKSEKNEIVRMILSGYSELNSITDDINHGSIFKFITKPWEDELLIQSVNEAFDYYELSEKNNKLTQELQESNKKL